MFFDTSSKGYEYIKSITSLHLRGEKHNVDASKRQSLKVVQPLIYNLFASLYYHIYWFTKVTLVNVIVTLLSSILNWRH